MVGMASAQMQVAFYTYVKRNNADRTSRSYLERNTCLWASVTIWLTCTTLYIDVGCSYTVEHPSLAKTVKRSTAGWVSGTDNDAILKSTNLELKALATLYYRSVFKCTLEWSDDYDNYIPTWNGILAYKTRRILFMAGLQDYPSIGGRSETYY